ncbi:GNAT family N-acetyltransferase [Prosthecomicrobium sp. N25]|uniref:GNAT family N-acetyltransferase n=1 Tax=Prosthecomicrobium sp. N25 TaxID=3129254 RepID=UPI0030769706
MSGLLWWFEPPPVSIETARSGDVPELAAIHAASFAHQWSADELRELLRDPAVLCLVARRANLFGTRRAVGFLLVRAAADEAEILTVAVDPRNRGRRIGRQLVEAGFRKLYGERIRTVFLEVDGGNAPAVALYRRLGFRQVGERKGYYRSASGPATSALVMRADLG